ncbi:hypothetical protein [Methylovulum psychrotolerans]|uniref:Uncharacterized protein n=1 Tax=Methylovulum psychrotolerans TaxID=1704499 RepID=A0A2S5CLM3_9GAMM|nr:hypothetical protein [Methylovulum psychrotolerans]POZ51678.1 hypothetical protein AADEFJLK_02548 [Methylovulum psychrotolerans]
MIPHAQNPANSGQATPQQGPVSAPLNRRESIAAGNALTASQTPTKNPPVTPQTYQHPAPQRGLEPLPLEPELLLKRIAQGGHSGQFLADAFLSAYRTDTPFLHSLSELGKLDAEGFRLFHQILHIRHVSGWSDDGLYQIGQQIKAITKAGK